MLLIVVGGASWQSAQFAAMGCKWQLAQPVLPSSCACAVSMLPDMVSEEMIAEDAFSTMMMAGAAMIARRRRMLPEVVNPRLTLCFVMFHQLCIGRERVMIFQQGKYIKPLHVFSRSCTR